MPERRLKTRQYGDTHELACQGCGGALPANRQAIIFLDHLPYCSDACSEKHEGPIESPDEELM
jgi:hypothetical protein